MIARMIRFTLMSSMTLAAAAGCGGIEGTWVAQLSETPQPRHHYRLLEATFNKDMTFETRADELGKTINARGTYKYDPWEKQLTLKADGKEQTYAAWRWGGKELRIERTGANNQTETFSLVRKGPCPWCANCAFCQKPGDTR